MSEKISLDSSAKVSLLFFYLLFHINMLQR